MLHQMPLMMMVSIHPTAPSLDCVPSLPCGKPVENIAAAISPLLNLAVFF